MNYRNFLYYDDIINRILELRADPDDCEWETELEDLEQLLEDNNDGDGLQLIPECKFVEHAENFADDIYSIDSSKWPFSHIDWEQAANDLKSDYSCVDLNGETFYYRS